MVGPLTPSYLSSATVTHTHYNNPHKHSCRTGSMKHSRVNAVICCNGDEPLSEGVPQSLSLEIRLREFKRFTGLECRVSEVDET